MRVLTSDFDPNGHRLERGSFGGERQFLALPNCSFEPLRSRPFLSLEAGHEAAGIYRCCGKA